MHSIDVKMKKLFLCMAMISLSVTFSVGCLHSTESCFPVPCMSTPVSRASSVT